MPARRGRPPSPQPAEQRVEAVERALGILDAFSPAEPRLSLAGLAARTGLYPSTILRLAASLERFGHLRRDADGRFALGPASLRLSLTWRAGFDLAARLRPGLARLVEASSETAAFYIRQGETRLCLCRQHPARLIHPHIEEGSALPLDRGASAHILRGFTGGEDDRARQARQQGVSLSLGERDPEAAAMAVPLWDGEGRFLGALGLTGPLSRFGPARRKRFEALLRAEAARLG